MSTSVYKILKCCIDWIAKCIDTIVRLPLQRTFLLGGKCCHLMQFFMLTSTCCIVFFSSVAWLSSYFSSIKEKYPFQFDTLLCCYVFKSIRIVGPIFYNLRVLAFFPMYDFNCIENSVIFHVKNWIFFKKQFRENYFFALSNQPFGKKIII